MATKRLFCAAITGALFTFGLSFAANVSANEKPTFDEYVDAIKAQALSKGYDKSLVDEAFDGLTYRKKVVKKDKTQPEVVQTLDTYLPKRVNPWVVKKARGLYKDNKALLDKIGQQYQVQPRFIVALWGLESAFGKYTGKFGVFASLTTLAYEGRRETLYRKQIFAALEIVKQGHIGLDKLKGSWAGAMGQTQFLPTSFLNYAVDFDNDGDKDIWQSKADVFASIANYLHQEGWNANLTWGRQVKLPEGFDVSGGLSGRTGSLSQWSKKFKGLQKPLSTWQQLGLTRVDGTALPNANIKAALVVPDDNKGRVYLAYDNYKTLMAWNRSYYFVTSVGFLADQIGYPAIK